VSEHRDREKQAARNELLFRAVNEQILGMTARFRAQLSEIDIVCECVDQTCVGTIRVAAEDFEKIERSDGVFLVLPGHEDAQVEDVVDRNGRYSVVLKRAPALRALYAIE
jgi:hypothetical protein